jgi:pimeloyl-ACP methyl ester carboxylesterase
MLLLILLLALVVPAQDQKDDSPHTSGFATVNGVKLHYLDWGGKGDVVLFITGMGSNAHVFDWMAPKFTEKYRVLALDRRGYGESEKPAGGYDTDTLTEDVRRFLDHMRVKRVILIGHSAAGNELTIFASKYPKRALKLVYMDAAYDRRDIPKIDAADPLPLPPPNSDPVQRKIDDVYYSELIGYVPNYKRIKAPVLSFYALFGKHPELRDDTSPEKQKEAETYMATIVRPFQNKQIEIFRRALPDARVIELTGTHHFFFLDPTKRDDVVKVIRDFLGASQNRD